MKGARRLARQGRRPGRPQAWSWRPGWRFGRAALLVLALSAPARALTPDLPVYEAGMRSYGLHLGAAGPKPTSGFDRMVRSGPAVNFDFYHYPWDWIALGGELGFSRFNKNDRGSANALNFGLLGRVNLLRERYWTPYLLGGLGKHLLSVKPNSGATVCNPLNGGCGADAKFEASSLSVTAGLGIEAFLMRGMSAAAETRFRRYRFNGGAAESLNITVGLRVYGGR